MRIFLAGATGVIGRRLVPLLVAAGHDVAGTTRSPERAEAITRAGGRPMVVDVYDRGALNDAVSAFRPDVVIHQLTDLTTPPGQPLGEAELLRNARIREAGTANLAAAARAAMLAVDHGSPGIYNIVDDGGPVSNAKARAELAWNP
jgi:Nucleoside-diphosphate-sugar epimerases